MTLPQYQVIEFVEDDMLGISFAYQNPDGTPINITGYTLVLEVKKPTGDVLTKTATITDAVNGLAVFSLASTDLNFPGPGPGPTLCDAQVKVTDNSGNTWRQRGFGIRLYPMLK